MERHLKQFNKSKRNISKWNWFNIVLFQGKKKEFAYFELKMEQGQSSNRVLKDHRWQGNHHIKRSIPYFREQLVPDVMQPAKGSIHLFSLVVKQEE